MKNINSDMTLKEARIIARSYGVSAKGFPALLSKPDSNPKILKNMKLGIMTAPLHLAPARISGFNTCADSTEACRKLCLNDHAGNPAFFVGKRRARLAKTILFFENRAVFMVLLFADIAWLARKSKKQGLLAGTRLNATSDIFHEVFALNGVTPIQWAIINDVEPYDYTKNFKRALAQPYHLTFSYNGHNDVDSGIILANGGTVAVVFGDGLPDSFLGYPVLNGDESDWRPGDKPGHIVGLKAKGLARYDRDSGFVVWNNKLESAA